MSMMPHFLGLNKVSDRVREYLIERGRKNRNVYLHGSSFRIDLLIKDPMIILASLYLRLNTLDLHVESLIILVCN